MSATRPIAEPSPDEGRWTHLDGLRGVAAVMVVACHFVFAFQPAFLSGDPAKGARAAATGLAETPLVLFWNPDFAVAVFFVLSGFVLAASSARAGAAGPLRRLTAQLLRRWLRLAGPILGSSLLIWAVVQAGLLRNAQVAALNGSDWIALNFSWLAWQANDIRYLIRQSFFDVFVFGPAWWNAALWTMPIEFAGSVAIFATYALLRGAGRRLRAAALAAAFAALWGTSYAGFAAGALLWESQAFWTAPRRGAWAAGGAALALAVVLGGMPYQLLHTFYWPAFVFASAHLTQPVLDAHRLGAILMVAAALSLPPLRRALRSRVPRALGRVSFMVYLCHIVVLCSLASWVVLRLTPVTGYDAATVAALAATLLALAPLTILMTRLADLPSIRLSRLAERRALAAMDAAPPVIPRTGRAPG